MEEPKQKLPNPEELEKMRAAMEEKADQYAKETVEEFTIGEGLLNPEEITPEMIQAIMAQARRQIPQSRFRRTGPSQLPKDARRKLRKLQRYARKTTIRNGSGRTISARKRAKKAI